MKEESLPYNITLIIKINHLDDDIFKNGVDKVDYINSFHKIVGDYFIVETIKDGYIIGDIIELKKIKSYKIWR